MSSVAVLVAKIQRSYPQIYLACHVDHIRATSTTFRLSAKDSMLLSHLDVTRGRVTAGKLARHLGVAASTLSAAIQRMETLGYLLRKPRLRDRRMVELCLTGKGAEAMAATSVLDPQRLAKMLSRLSPRQAKRAVSGLGLLAWAALELQSDQPKRAGGVA